MILKLDKGDVKEVFSEFVDETLRETINAKIRSLFDERVESIIKQQMLKINLDREIENRITNMTREYFKADWSGKHKFVEDVVREEMKKINFDEKFQSEGVT